MTFQSMKKMDKMSRGLSFSLCLVACLWTSTYAEDNGSDITTQQTPENGTTVPDGYSEHFYIQLAHKESQTTSIAIKWKVPYNFVVSQYKILSNKLDSDALIHSPLLGGDKVEYIVEDLMTNEFYNVCVLATVFNGTNLEEEKEFRECMEFTTIPLIRDDSLIVLFCVIGYLLLMILIGYLCWRYAKSQKESDEDDEKIEPSQTKNQYQVPPGNRPHSSIEDEDIPYITPPYDQLDNEEKQTLKKFYPSV